MAPFPYADLPPRQFWKTAVADRAGPDFPGLYRRKFAIEPQHRIATAGSCFAQHIARHLVAHGYAVIDNEPAPPGLSAQNARKFGYGLFSCRTGNVYTARQLLQLAQEATGRRQPAEAVWERDGAWFDALRPGVEPEGLGSPEEVLAHRASHLRHVRRMLEQADLFIFTFGLTEAWAHVQDETVYPSCPGAIAGVFDPARHAFRNFTAAEVRRDFLAFRSLVQRRKPGMRFLLTVSPVPLTATASGHHVLSATTYSKSVLRAVAGELAQEFPDIDYFPSYEIISTPWSAGYFSGANRRTVADEGVAAVMQAFFAEHPVLAAPAAPAPASAADDVCEDVLLEAFHPR